MEKTVSLVFKIIIITVILGTFVTLAGTLIDVFITTSRVQSVSEFVKFDIAQNNCLLNDTYTMFVDELYNISSKSSCMSVGVATASNEKATTGLSKYKTDFAGEGRLQYSDVTSTYAIELYPKGSTYGTAGTRDFFIQKQLNTSGSPLESSALYPGVLNPAGYDNSKAFFVAPYGEVLTLNINMFAHVYFWRMASGEDANLGNVGYTGWNVPVTLTYNVPALAYIK